MAKSPEDQMREMRDNLAQTTGKDMDAWKLIIQASGLKKHGEILKMLKEVHGITHGYANMITHFALASFASALVAQNVDLEASWFEGKSEMRPVYDLIMQIIFPLGADIVQSPKKGYMSLRRNRQFACIGPFTKSKLDLQIHLKDHPGTARLKPVKAGMTSHVIKIGAIEDIDDEVKGWLAEAYAAC